MRNMNIRDAKAGFSALVDAVEHGESVTITRHGKPAAVIIPLDLAAKIIEDKKPNFADFLMTMPADIEFERNTSTGRNFEF